MLSLESYGHEDDWQYIDNVLDATIRFSLDRSLPIGITNDPVTGVKVLVCNPDSKLVPVGEGSMLSSDRIITVWLNTVLQDSTQVSIDEGDIIEVGTGDDTMRYIVISLLETIWSIQARCFCRRIPVV